MAIFPLLSLSLSLLLCCNFACGDLVTYFNTFAKERHTKVKSKTLLSPSQFAMNRRERKRGRENAFLMHVSDHEAQFSRHIFQFCDSLTLTCHVVPSHWPERWFQSLTDWLCHPKGTHNRRKVSLSLCFSLPHRETKRVKEHFEQTKQFFLSPRHFAIALQEREKEGKDKSQERDKVNWAFVRNWTFKPFTPKLIGSALNDDCTNDSLICRCWVSFSWRCFCYN